MKVVLAELFPSFKASLASQEYSKADHLRFPVYLTCNVTFRHLRYPLKKMNMRWRSEDEDGWWSIKTTVVLLLFSCRKLCSNIHAWQHDVQDQQEIIIDCSRVCTSSHEMSRKDRKKRIPRQDISIDCKRMSKLLSLLSIFLMMIMKWWIRDKK